MSHPSAQHQRALDHGQGADTDLLGCSQMVPEALVTRFLEQDRDDRRAVDDHALQAIAEDRLTLGLGDRPAEDGLGELRPRLILQEPVETLGASLPTLASLQPFLAFLQGSPNRLGLGLVRQRGDLGGRASVRVLDVHCHGGMVAD